MKPWKAFLIVLLAFFVMMFVTAPPTFVPKPAPGVPAGPVSKLPAHYNFSIVPGGVHSPKEAGLPQGHAEVLDHNMLAYVNYKRGGQVYWTSHPVLIMAGETIYTDGNGTVRSRCGNSISFLPKAPTEPVDVSYLLDLVEVPPLPAPVPPDTLSNIPALPVAVAPPTQPGNTLEPLPGGGIIPVYVPVNPVVTVPENSAVD